MQDFKELKVWQRAHQLTLAIYRDTACFPREELYGLTNQIQRASVSVSSNIAEGCGRGSNAEFERFLHIAMGSASELEYQLLLSHDLQYMNDVAYEQLQQETVEMKRMLNGLIQKVSANH
jgi:four helix bundle protein